MMLICENCGSVFHDPDYHDEEILHTELDYNNIEHACVATCPDCGSEYIEDAGECVVCGEYTFKDRGICKDCEVKAKKIVEFAKTLGMNGEDAVYALDEYNDMEAKREKHHAGRASL